jgi:hypothetical protein
VGRRRCRRHGGAAPSHRVKAAREQAAQEVAVAERERRLRDIRDELDERIDKVDDAAQEAATQVGGEAMSHVDALDRTLRDFLADALSGGRSAIGVAPSG